MELKKGSDSDGSQTCLGFAETGGSSEVGEGGVRGEMYDSG